MMGDPNQKMTRDIAVVCSDKLYRIRQLVEREPTTSLANRILTILDEPNSVREMEQR